jgi:hypothetical protein
MPLRPAGVKRLWSFGFGISARVEAVEPALGALFLLIRTGLRTPPPTRRDSRIGMGPLRQSGQKTVGDNRRPAKQTKED